ncbi:MAG TPA: DNA-binding domain-containing protein [Gammaproteobacteria bacterium]|nr:DNA-binding domain-containing protein [Gammaproteobacteria bacterium]
MTTAPPLHKLQRDFMAWVLGDASSGAVDSVRGNGLAPDARLGIYRNIVFSNLTATLTTDYPVVKALVGEAFFENAATRYIRDEPSRSGNLQDYGAGFPEFLARLPEAASLPYLADAARLEWARQESLLAADAAPLDPTRLMDVPETKQDALRLQLHPSLRLVDSAHPILDIWLFCQEQQDEGLKLDGSGQSVMLWRSEDRIAMRAIGTGMHALLRAMQNGETLSTAHAAAIAADENFDFEAALQGLFSDALITGYDY